MPTHHPYERGSEASGDPHGEGATRQPPPSPERATRRPEGPERSLPWDLDEAGPVASRRLFQGTPKTTALILLLMILATASLAWIGGEQHYQSCAVAQAARFGQGNDPLTRLARVNAVNDCSRWPF
jgi:hypothetical protein